MRNVGIVRRLDELGRIVIPREFRKTYRIEVGDPLEISATDEGKIIISKIDYVTDIIQQGASACTTLSEELGLTVALSSFESFVSVAGANKNAVLSKSLPLATIKLLRARGSHNGTATSDETGKLGELGFEYAAVFPVAGIDGCLGGLFAFSNSPISQASALTLKITAKVLGDSVQKY